MTAAPRPAFANFPPGPDCDRMDRPGRRREEDAFYAAMFALSDGRIGVRAAVDPFDEEAGPGLYCAGVFGPGDDYESGLVRPVDPLPWRVSCGGMPLSLAPVGRVAQTLDMGHGHGEMACRLADPRGRDHDLALAVAVVPLGSGSLILREIVWRPAAPYRRAVLALGTAWAPLWAPRTVTGPSSGRPVVTATSTQGARAAIAVAMAVQGVHPRSASAERLGPPSMSVDLDGPVRFIQWIAVATGPDGPGATAAVDDIAGIVERTGPAALIERHRASWTDRWASVPRLQGDPAAADGLRFGHFHLAQAPDLASSSQMIAPRGLTDQRHGGLGFFNTDLFLTPYYALREPAVARSLLANRLSGMGAARRYAARRGWPGLWFPLVVDPRGEPVAARHPGREAIAQSSLHMTAAVLYGLSRYRAATGDWPVEPQLVDRLMTEARSFQQAILDRDAPATGFDEFHPAVRGHAATLGLARWALDWISAPDSMGGPVDCLGLEPGDDGAIEAFRGYRDLPERLCTNDGPGGLPRLTGAERAAAADGRALDSRLVKQADVVLMLALFPDRFPTEVAAACLDYYGCRTAHASSLSPAAHGLVAMRCGRSEQGWRYIAKALRWNLDFQPRETYRNGVHLAASAAGWLSIIDGILGLRVSTARRQATLRPRLPPQVRSLSGTTTLLGRHIDWRVEDGRIDVAGPGIACHRHGNGAAAVTVTIPE